MSEPVLSVVLVNWNAAGFIVDCLRSVLESDLAGLQIILVDNASDDASLRIVRDSFSPTQLSRIKIIANEKNFGAAYALNQGAKVSTAKYIAFLATDTLVDKKCFSEYLRVFKAYPDAGALSAKLLLMDDHKRIDSAGEYLSPYGILLQRHAGKEIDRGQFSRIEEIFSAKGTALAVRRDVFLKAGGFPEDYFMLLEETDLCWRIWLLGFKILFVPDAVIYHASGASINSSPARRKLVHYFGTRNYLWTMIKNFGLLRLIFTVSLSALMWLGLGLVLLLKGRFGDSAYVIRGVFWPLMHPFKIFRQRKAVQKMRKVKDSHLFKKVMRPVGLSYLLDRVRTW